MGPYFGRSCVACGLKLSRPRVGGDKELVRDYPAKPRFWMSVAREKPSRPKVSAHGWSLPVHINETTKYEKMMLKIKWNDQLKNYLKSPDMPLQLFNKFCNWMNQKKRVDYLINQNRNSIIAHEVEPINWRNEQEEQSMRITGNARNAKNLKSIPQINFKLITRATHPPLRRAGAL